jgi:hypothetical protein
MSSVLDEFMSTAVNSSSALCIEWPFRLDRFGYGEIVRLGVRKAHRVVFTLAFGGIPEGMHVLHMCDNPGCVNPSHLFAGSHSENMEDMRRKGRAAAINNKGILHGKCKLTEDDVRDIRKSYSEKSIPQGKIAKQYGISRQAVCDICRHVTWSHIT